LTREEKAFTLLKLMVSRHAPASAVAASSKESLLECLPRRAFVREVAGYGYGQIFLEALLLNLRLTASLFQGDREFEGRLGAAKRENAESVLSELWLAAHLVRLGAAPRRPSTKVGLAGPDFLADIPLEGGTWPCRLEAKRMFPPTGHALVSSSDMPRGLKSGGAWPWSLSSSDFGTTAGKRLRRAKRQLPARTSAELAGFSPVLALDVTGSKTYQLLLTDQDEDLLRRVHQVADVHTTRSLFLYVVPYDRPTLFKSRWFIDPRQLTRATTTGKDAKTPDSA
jgi:hypothetical protein